MGLKQTKISAIGLLLVILLTQIPVTQAQATQPVGTSGATQLTKTLEDTVKKKLKDGALFVLGLQNKLGQSSRTLNSLKGNITLLEEELTGAREDIMTLQGQLTNIKLLIDRNNTKIAATTLLIAEDKNKISILGNEVRARQAQIDEQKEIVQKTMTSYFLQTSALGSYMNQDDKLLAMLSYGEGIGDAAQMQDYLHSLESKSYEMIAKLIAQQAEMEAKETELKTTNEDLIQLQNALAQEKKNLIDAQDAISRLLIETAGKESTYQQLLETSKKEEVHVSLEIQRLQENFAFFQSKLNELRQAKESGNFDAAVGLKADDFAALSQLRGSSLLAWPVSPALGISAFFHDVEYQGALGVQHQAVDIRATQGTAIHAAADGIVSKAADNGMGYSYIIVAHEKGLMTLYGHVLDIQVKVGDTVRQGQTIGLTGGMPGTKGAGWLTTGPHLHLEVFKDFKHVDPLLYLPLEYIPQQLLSSKYIKKAIGTRLDEKIAIPQ